MVIVGDSPLSGIRVMGPIFHPCPLSIWLLNRGEILTPRATGRIHPPSCSVKKSLGFGTWTVDCQVSISPWHIHGMNGLWLPAWMLNMHGGKCWYIYWSHCCQPKKKHKNLSSCKNSNHFLNEDIYIYIPQMKDGDFSLANVIFSGGEYSSTITRSRTWLHPRLPFLQGSKAPLSWSRSNIPRIFFGWEEVFCCFFVYNGHWKWIPPPVSNTKWVGSCAK